MKININDKRHSLTLLEKNGNYFKCKCKCGQLTTIHRGKFGITKSCGCFKHRTGKDNPQYKGYEGIHKGKWNTYVRNAKSRNIPFDISIKEAWKILVDQGFKCVLSGEPISLWKNATIRQSTASLDRIDSHKGYIVGNVHWVHKKINQIKMDMNTDEFINWCKKVADK